MPQTSRYVDTLKQDELVGSGFISPRLAEMMSNVALCVAGSQGAHVAMRLLKERADTAEARAAAAVRQASELKASLQLTAAAMLAMGTPILWSLVCSRVESGA